MTTRILADLEAAIAAAMEPHCEDGLGFYVDDGLWARMARAAALVCESSEAGQKFMKREEGL